ncbi:hypothetical protein [Martelella alba]|uniref:Uncharacterized protein n=1 Tax=Martelella alba TaxID=2590451 RepID=A0ABY2SKU9_9HYPH|nr:hypothetical protein [Martelella alba]TKI06086.1 hypothetical protein FCN80_11220 [Martelella alba]
MSELNDSEVIPADAAVTASSGFSMSLQTVIFPSTGNIGGLNFAVRDALTGAPSRNVLATISMTGPGSFLVANQTVSGSNGNATTPVYAYSDAAGLYRVHVIKQSASEVAINVTLWDAPQITSRIQLVFS